MYVRIGVDMSTDDRGIDLPSNRPRTREPADGPAQRRGVRDGYKLMSIGDSGSKQIVYISVSKKT